MLFKIRIDEVFSTFGLTNLKMKKKKCRTEECVFVFSDDEAFFRTDEPKNYFRNDEASEIENLHFGMKTCRNEDCSE